MKKNIDKETVQSFSNEWNYFDQSKLGSVEAEKIFNEYFSIFPWSSLPKNATGFDMGCGSGRWAKLISPLVGHLHCIDPSDSINVAKENLSSFNNITYHQASVDDWVLPPNTQDFGYSLGVLHHLPNTASAINSCVSMLKPGSPFLLYLYYALETRSLSYKLLWISSDLARQVISKLPEILKVIVTDIFAVLIYYPFARISNLLERMGFDVESIPLSYYRKHSFYTMRTDSRDRFGTPLERRFHRNEIKKMMLDAGLSDIQFSENAPFWCALGIKR